MNGVSQKITTTDEPGDSHNYTKISVFLSSTLRQSGGQHKQQSFASLLLEEVMKSETSTASNFGEIDECYGRIMDSS